MDAMTTGVLVVGGAALLAWVLRGVSGGDEKIDRDLLSGRDQASAPGGSSTDEAGPTESELAVEEAGAEGEVAVVTADGWMFMPFENGVQVWAPVAPDEDAADARLRGEMRVRPAGAFSAGDMIAARVAPGEPGEPPWRVETLGRDREFSAWSFDTEPGAREVCELLERVVVKVPVGPDGEPEPVSDAEMTEARRVVEETIRELARAPEDAEPEEPR